MSFFQKPRLAEPAGGVARALSGRWGRAAVLAVVCGLSFGLHAGAPGVSLMESRNFVAAREMVAGGSWLIPTMNHELRLAKPPLPTWAVAALQLLTGPTENLALLRLPAALAATLFVFFFWGLARELTRGLPGETTSPGQAEQTGFTAWLAALVLATSLLVVTTGREGQWDIFATSFATGALWLLLRGWQRPVGSGVLWLNLAGAGVLAGLAILSKGPVPVYVLLLPFLLAYLVGQPAHRAAVRARVGATGLAAGLAVLLGGSWPLYIWLKVAPAARAVARLEISSWAERHVQPVWYYWPFFAFTGLWAAVALAALVWPYARPRLRAYAPYAVVLAWALGGLLLLSIVPEKKERYMLPLMPPLALLVAALLRYWQVAGSGIGTPPELQLRPADGWIMRGWGGLLVVLLVALPVSMVLTGFPGFGIGSWRFIVASVSVVAVVLWPLRRGIAARHAGLLIGSTLATVVLIVVLVLPAYPRWEGRRDVPGRLHMAEARRLPGVQGLARWYSLDTLHVKQVWAAGQAVPIWHPTSAALAALREPVVVVSEAAAVGRLPAGWATKVRLTPLAEFYLDRDKKSAVWRISRIDPK